jgi:hypothetical protein
MKNIAVILLVTYAILLTACESTVTDINLPDSKSKLVVVSFISPSDDIISVLLIESAPLYGVPKKSQDKVIRNAAVSISEGANTLELSFNPATNAYEASAEAFKIQYRKTYTLTVSTPDGRKATARCTVPGVKVETATNSLDSIGKTFMGQSGSTWHLNAAWPHVPGADFYRLAVSRKSISITNSGTNFYDDLANYGKLRSSHIAVKEKEASSYSFANIPVYLSHDDLDGPFDSAGFKNRTTSLTVFIMVTSQEYYRYHESIERYSEGVFSEPSQVYTNVNGGLGVFGAYTAYSQQFDF